ncbi:hypothetical protein HNY73_011350 [Argiope bruennichi]|uniref:Uncharacterized protein n=1 Tax=Argiope bruennichi TaxID=94029 RepID=A0A8T0F8V6_ARGBR|nr:hypothetical protein HNY73_011350 [Argiope bruennichi]
MDEMPVKKVRGTESGAGKRTKGGWQRKEYQKRRNDKEERRPVVRDSRRGAGRPGIEEDKRGGRSTKKRTCGGEEQQGEMAGMSDCIR